MSIVLTCKTFDSRPFADDDEELRALAAHLHRLGPRAVYELLREIIINGPDPYQRLRRYAELDPAIVKYLGADRLDRLVDGDDEHGGT
jgi:hypothetical protein